MSRLTLTAVQPYKAKTLNEKYLLGEELGRGAYGRVYKGVDLQNGDFVAIKQVSLDNISPEDLTSIMQEIDLLKGLDHNNIVKYLGSFKTKSDLYIILEFVENGSLASIIKPTKFGVFPESLVAVYIAQVLEGLVYLHEQGVIHRDIKGANILTTKAGLVKLADFGVATKLTEAEAGGADISQAVVGTPYWMAPEVIEMAGVCAASDVWSVGCTVIELLTGVPPYYDLQPMPALFRIVQDEAPPFPDGLSQGITDFLRQCFHKDAKRRPDAVALLGHPWISMARRSLQASLADPASAVSKRLSEDVSTVVGRSIEAAGPAPGGPLQSTAAAGGSLQKDASRTPGHDRGSMPDGASPNWPSGETGGGLSSLRANGEGFGAALLGPVSPLMSAARSPLAAESSSAAVTGARTRRASSPLPQALKPQGSASDAKVGHGQRQPPRKESTEASKGEQRRGPHRLHGALPSPRGAGEAAEMDTMASALEAKLGIREQHLPQKEEAARLVDELVVLREEGLILRCLAQLKDLLPKLKKPLPVPRCVLPLVELLHCPNVAVVHAALEVLCMLMANNSALVEALCLAGLITAAMQLSAAERTLLDVQLQAAQCISCICQSSPQSMNMFIACRGLPSLVGFLEPDITKHRSLVQVGLEGIWRAVESAGAASGRLDVCRMLAKSGVLLRLANTLHTIATAPAPSAPPSDGPPLPTAGEAVDGGGGKDDMWYLACTAGLLLEMARADEAVRALFSQSVLKRLLDSLPALPPPVLLKVLRCLRHLASDAGVLEPLQRADAVQRLVPLLDARVGVAMAEVQSQAIVALYNLCKVNRRRQELAAEAGIIPPLLHLVAAGSPLKQYALPLLCEMAQASRATREILRTCGALELYLALLRDEYWAVPAIDSLAFCMAHDGEQRRVEQRLCQQDALDKLVALFAGSSGPLFLHALDAFLKMIMKSIRLVIGLAGAGLAPLLLARLDHYDPVARLSLLKILKAVCEQHAPSKRLLVEQELQRKLQLLVEERQDGDRSGGQVLVKQMATSLLKTLQTKAT